MYYVERYFGDNGATLELTLLYGTEGEKVKGITTVIFGNNRESDSFKKIEEYNTNWRRR